MTTPYLTPETAEALRRLAVSVPGEHGLGRADVIPLDALASFPIVGAVPAEGALAKLGFLADLAVANKLGDYNVGELDAAVRHALRAATRCPTCGVATVPLESGATAIIGRPVVTLTGTQAQADAPPPPDVIRRGHEAAESLAYAAAQGSHRHLPADAEALLEQTKAALYPLKEK